MLCLNCARLGRKRKATRYLPLGTVVAVLCDSCARFNVKAWLASKELPERSPKA